MEYRTKNCYIINIQTSFRSETFVWNISLCGVYLAKYNQNNISLLLISFANNLLVPRVVTGE
jgi:hypothetical protein